MALRPRAVWAALACCLATAATRAEDNVALLNGVTVKSTDTAVTVRVDFSQPCNYKLTVMRDPCRFVYDFAETRLRADQTRTWDLNHQLLTALRVGQYGEQPPVARLVFQLPARREITVERVNKGCTLLYKLAGGAGTPEADAERKPVIELGEATWEQESDTGATLVLGLSQMTPCNVFALDRPERVVVDIEGTTLKAQPPGIGEANGLVAAVRMTQYTPDIVRVVVQLKRTAGHVLQRRLSPSRLVLRLAAGEAKGRLVVLDPGHGGKDNGCTGYRAGLFEREIVLDIGLRARKLLEPKGIRVEMTRADDTFIPLEERPALANSLGADAFVSIHCNAMPEARRGQRSGHEVYYWNALSVDFAATMLEEVAKQVGLEARGTYQRRFVVVRGCTMPSVLVETGYLCHEGDGKLLETPEGRQQCALGIVHGVVRFFQQTPRQLAKAPTKEAKG